MIPQVPPGHLPSVLHCPCMHACMHACRSLTRAITRTHTQTQPAREEERVSFYFIKSRLQRRRAASTCGGRSKKEGAMRRRARPARESSRSVRRMVVAVTVPLRPSVVTQTRSSDTALSSRRQLRSQAGHRMRRTTTARRSSCLCGLRMEAAGRAGKAISQIGLPESLGRREKSFKMDRL